MRGNSKVVSDRALPGMAMAAHKGGKRLPRAVVTMVRPSRRDPSLPDCWSRSNSQTQPQITSAPAGARLLAVAGSKSRAQRTVTENSDAELRSAPRNVWIAVSKQSAGMLYMLAKLVPRRRFEHTSQRFSCDFLCAGFLKL